MSNHTNEFFNLIRSIGETKSKAEEDLIIQKETALLKQHFHNIRKNPNQSKQLREYLIRMLYCELLGHPASFGYFFAVTATSSTSLSDKRVGYLATSLCLPKEDEFVLLLTSNMQKDLQSTNYLEVVGALTVACKMVTQETIPALLPFVLRLKKHHEPIVRKKAYIFIQCAVKIYPELVPNCIEHGREGLCDRDPSVMGASLCLLEDIIEESPELPEHKVLASSFVNILKQIIEHRLSRDYDYHRLPAPWLQIKILKILGMLGKDDQKTSKIMYDVLKDVIRRADTGLNIGHAIVFECIKTISSIYPNSQLLDLAAGAISRFVESKNNNLKYIGINSLASLVIINPKYANQHQMSVIECLEDRDVTLQRITLNLLFTMTNPNNVKIITNKILDFSRRELDKNFQRELLLRVTKIAEKFAPDNYWYIDTLNHCFLVDASLISNNVIQTLITVIAEGSGEDDSEDEALRIYCVDKFFDLIEKTPALHDIHIQVMSWILGEYGYLSRKHSQEEIISLLCDLADRRLEFNATRSWIFSATLKLISQSGKEDPNVLALVKKYMNSRSVDLQQRCYEFATLSSINDKELMRRVLPMDGSCEEIAVDENLAFLNSVVEEALLEGAPEYVNEDNRDFSEPDFKKPELKIEAEPVDNRLPVVSYNPYQNNGNDGGDDLSNPEESTHTKKPNTGELNSSLFKNARQIWYDEDDEDAPQPELTQSQSLNPQPQQIFNDAMNGTNSFSSSGQSGISSSGGIGSGGIGSSSYSSPHSEQEYTPSPKYTYEEEKVVSAKSKKLMNALFSGSDSTPSPNSRNRANRVQRENKPSPPRQSNNLLSLGDFDLDAPSEKPESQNASNAINTNEPWGDLLDQNSISPQQNVSQSKQLQQVSDFDIFGDPKSTPPQEDTKPHTSVGSDGWMDSLFDSPISSASGSQITSNFKTQAKLEIQMQNKKFGETSIVCKDSYICLSEERYLGENQLIIMLSLKTERGYILNNVKCQFQNPTNFKFQLETDCDSSNCSTGKDHITFKKLQPASPQIVIIKLEITNLSFGTTLMGAISYSDDQQQRRFNNFSVGLSVISLLRPLEYNTSNFGSKWGSHTREKKVTVKSDVTFEGLQEMVTKSWNLYKIQSIDNEVICSARLINLNEVILAHFKVIKNKGSIVVTIRSQDTSLSSHLALSIQKYF